MDRRSFLQTSSKWLGAGAMAPWALRHVAAAETPPSAPLMAYVGTYSSPLPIIRPGQVDLPPGNGKGIHAFHVDRTTGALQASAIHEMPTSPSFLVVNSAGDRLYSTNETEKSGPHDAGSVSSFAIDRATGQLTHLNTVSSEAAGPTYASLHPSGKFLFVANYFGGAVTVLPILTNGQLGAATDVQRDAGTVGPKKAPHAPAGSFAFSGHDLPHAHMVAPDPKGNFILSVDLGLDQILVWKFDTASGKLTPNNPAALSFPPGDGPRHFAFHPNGRWLYSLQEEASTIVVCDYDAERGVLAPRQSLSSLPPGFAGSSFSSEILVSPDGRFVYAGNRLHDGIACFSVGPDGQLTYVSEAWTGGDYPRSFEFDPSSRHLYCCNQRADNVTCFKVNRPTGALDFTGQYTAVGNPSMITFLDLAKESH